MIENFLKLGGGFRIPVQGHQRVAAHVGRMQAAKGGHRSASSLEAGATTSYGQILEPTASLTARTMIGGAAGERRKGWAFRRSGCALPATGALRPPIREGARSSIRRRYASGQRCAAGAPFRCPTETLRRRVRRVPE